MSYNCKAEFDAFWELTTSLIGGDMRANLLLES